MGRASRSDVRLLGRSRGLTRAPPPDSPRTAPRSAAPPAIARVGAIVPVVVPPDARLSHGQFLALVRANRHLRLEQTAAGELIAMPPTGSETGRHNADLSGQLWLWNRQAGLGVAFDSSTGFHLPNGADRSPDAAWVRRDRWDALSPADREGFAPLCPDFVLGLRSASDRLAGLQAKLREYLDNGAQLGWLVDRPAQAVEIYRPNRPVERRSRPPALSGETVLPGFELDLRSLWPPERDPARSPDGSES